MRKLALLAILMGVTAGILIQRCVNRRYEVVISVEEIDFPAQLTAHTVQLFVGTNQSGGICVGNENYILTCAHAVASQECPELKEMIEQLKKDMEASMTEEDKVNISVLFIEPEAPKIFVKNAYGTQVEAVIVKSDRDRDLTLLRLVSCLDLTPVEFNDSGMKTGDVVFGVGHWTVTTAFCYSEGILARADTYSIMNRAHYVFSTPTLIGCSGTGMFRKSGECAGIVDLAWNTGQGAAIPASVIEGFLADVEF